MMINQLLSVHHFQSVVISHAYEEDLDNSPRHVFSKREEYFNNSLSRQLWILLFDSTPKLAKKIVETIIVPSDKGYGEGNT